VTAIAAGVAAAKKEEQPSVEIPEEMPGADVASASLSRSAVSTEDELRAQAEQDAERAWLRSWGAPRRWSRQTDRRSDTLVAVIEPEAEAEIACMVDRRRNDGNCGARSRS